MEDDGVAPVGTGQRASLADRVGDALAKRGGRDAHAVLSGLDVAERCTSIVDRLVVSRAAGRAGVEAFPGGDPLLACAAALGAAERAVSVAATYLRDHDAHRLTADGQPVGYMLARHFARIDGAELLVQRAVGDAEPAIVARARWWAARAALPALAATIECAGEGGALRALFLGLSDFATALLLRDGDPDLLLEGAGEAARGQGWFGNDRSEEIDHWQAGATVFLATRFGVAEKMALAEGQDHHLPDMVRRLAAARLLVPDWPMQRGGSDAPAVAAAAVKRTLAEGGWPTAHIAVTHLMGHMVQRFGSAEAKAEFLPNLASGKALCALALPPLDAPMGWPHADPDGDGWRVNGSNVPATPCDYARYLMLGVTMPQGRGIFVMPIRDAEGDLLPGFSIRHGEDGAAAHIIALSDFWVADQYRLGGGRDDEALIAAARSLDAEAGEGHLSLLGRIDCALDGIWPGLKPSPAARMARARLKAHIALLECMMERNLRLAGTDAWQPWHDAASALVGASVLPVQCQDLLERLAPASLAGKQEAFRLIARHARPGMDSQIGRAMADNWHGIIAGSLWGLPA